MTGSQLELSHRDIGPFLILMLIIIIIIIMRMMIIIILMMVIIKTIMTLIMSMRIYKEEGTDSYDSDQNVVGDNEAIHTLIMIKRI